MKNGIIYYNKDDLSLCFEYYDWVFVLNQLIFIRPGMGIAAVILTPRWM